MILALIAPPSLRHVYFTLGDYRLAGEFTQRNIEALDGQLVFERFGLPIYPAVYSRHSRVMALSHIGLFSEAIVCGTEGCRIAESIKHPLTRIYADYALGYAYLLCGDLGQAIRHFERDRELCQEIGARLVSAYILSFLGIAYAQSVGPRRVFLSSREPLICTAQ